MTVYRSLEPESPQHFREVELRFRSAYGFPRHQKADAPLGRSRLPDPVPDDLGAEVRTDL